MFRLEREEQWGETTKQGLSRKMKIREILNNLEPEYFLTELMMWMKGKNVFIEEGCMILNFGLVVTINQQNIFLTYQVLWRLAISPTVSDQLQQPQPQPWYPWHERSKHMLNCLGCRIRAGGLIKCDVQGGLPWTGHAEDPLCCGPSSRQPEY